MKKEDMLDQIRRLMRELEKLEGSESDLESEAVKPQFRSASSPEYDADFFTRRLQSGSEPKLTTSFCLRMPVSMNQELRNVASVFRMTMTDVVLTGIRMALEQARAAFLKVKT